MAIELLKQENSFYEAPKVDVVELAVSDIVRTSPENGGEDNGAWWD